MVQITIRDLHMKTGAWVRKAACSGGIVVTDRRQPVAKLVSFTAGDQKKPFAARRIVKGFSTLPKSAVDSTRYLSRDRERG